LAAAAFLNSVAQEAVNLFMSRLLLMQSCISDPCARPQNFFASFLQSRDTESLDDDEAAGADAAGGFAGVAGVVAVCP